MVFCGEECDGAGLGVKWAALCSFGLNCSVPWNLPTDWLDCWLVWYVTVPFRYFWCGRTHARPTESKTLMITLSLPRVINFKLPLQPRQKYNITQFEELGFSSEGAWCLYLRLFRSFRAQQRGINLQFWSEVCETLQKIHTVLYYHLQLDNDKENT